MRIHRLTSVYHDELGQGCCWVYLPGALMSARALQVYAFLWAAANHWENAMWPFPEVSGATVAAWSWEGASAAAGAPVHLALNPALLSIVSVLCAPASITLDLEIYMFPATARLGIAANTCGRQCRQPIAVIANPYTVHARASEQAFEIAPTLSQ